MTYETNAEPARGGYASRGYAQSLAPWGQIWPLPASGGSLLLRPIPGGAERDASGCYPVFSCPRWPGLAGDLRQLPPDLVALSLVTDPFCPLAVAELKAMFGFVRLLGDHYLVDLTAAPPPSRHHRRKLREAPAGLDIALAGNPSALLDDWVLLYDMLSRKRGIRGLRRFSRQIFAAQLAVPGTVVFVAELAGRLLGLDWYYQDQDRVFAHLSAYSEEGYQHSVSYPLMAAAIAHFRTRASVLDLGGAPAVAVSNSGGIAAFKAGWSTRTLPSYLCGSVLMHDEYLRLSGGRTASADAFFPHYRRGEF
jgi:hypothetical protein